MTSLPLPVTIVAAALVSLAMLVLPAASSLPAAPARAQADTPDVPLAGPALLDALRGGGNVLLFRHAATDYSQSDTDRQNLAACETQRNLSDAGRAQARAIGEAIRRLGIPIGTVLASPYCRTLETARLAFERAEPSADLVSQLSDEGPDGRARLTAALRALLARPPGPGTNTVLVSHALNIEDAIGRDIEEGEAAVARPDDAGGFAVVARVEAGGWNALERSP